MLDEIRKQMRAEVLADEAGCVARLIALADLDGARRTAIGGRAAELVRQVRARGQIGVMESFLAEYGLSTREGVALMCLAEAMLRVPDSETVVALIRDKITPHDWGKHLGDSGSILVNASTWALLLTGKVLDESSDSVVGALHSLTRRLGEPLLRKAVGQAMKEMGAQFVLGRTMAEAMRRGEPMVDKGYSYSYDMLGEAARTEVDALRYHRAYAAAIAAIGRAARSGDVRANPGISVKLSALHPRYEWGQREAMLPVLVERLGQLARAAATAGIGCNIDAEEADRLDLSLDVIAETLKDPALAGWDGFGVVVQAYGRRAPRVLDWLYALAGQLDRRIMVRLVKGAYWDTEIKRAQVMGLSGYPVFTRKPHSDVSYIACAAKLLSMTDRIYPQFATHNAHSLAAVLEMAGQDRGRFEFQRLHGMGEALHEIVRETAGTRCRIYAPVGAHRDLLAYLVRRLLENGANSSFVNQIVDESVSPERIAEDPIALTSSWGGAANPRIPRPAEIFGRRRNSQGWDLTDPQDLALIEAGRMPFAAPHRWQAKPITPAPRNDSGGGSGRAVTSPAEPEEMVGEVVEADPVLASAAVAIAAEAAEGWAARPAEERRRLLLAVADLYEAETAEFLALACREAGKTLADGIAEVREAVDFLRYYADEALRLPGHTRARGPIVCISPWNFPLAIFTGQIAAALAAGNAVLAKPAEQTALIAAKAVGLMRQAGIPAEVLQLLPGDGRLGAALTADPRIAGIAFTGSTEVAKLIDRQLAESAPDAMLIAETGGLNAMIVDSTALLEQAVRDIVNSAFRSAGQRCSALRILYVQKEIEADLMEMLSGAVDLLSAGDPWRLSTDLGPVIDREAYDQIQDYLDAERRAGRLLMQGRVPDRGLFVPPSVIKVTGIAQMEREVFGPVLHVASFSAGELEAVVAAINAKGYGLTFGLHTRIDRRVQEIVDDLHVGNLYVNRDQIGAVVGSQPFGGEGLSGTGPKAGGPLYVRRFRRAEHAELADEEQGRELDLAEVASLAAGLDAGAWIGAKDRIGVLRSALRGRAAEAVAAAASIDSGPVDLPGPTGESNQLFMPPRGLVLCLGPDPESLLAQTVQALALGNAVLALAAGAREALRPLTTEGLPLAVAEGRPSDAVIEQLPFDALAYAGSDAEARRLRRACARRAGPILLPIRPVLAPAAYCAERTVCIDTTAAGGNASLLSAAE